MHSFSFNIGLPVGDDGSFGNAEFCRQTLTIRTDSKSFIIAWGIRAESSSAIFCYRQRHKRHTVFDDSHLPVMGVKDRKDNRLTQPVVGFVTKIRQNDGVRHRRRQIRVAIQMHPGVGGIGDGMELFITQNLITSVQPPVDEFLGQKMGDLHPRGRAFCNSDSYHLARCITVNAGDNSSVRLGLIQKIAKLQIFQSTGINVLEFIHNGKLRAVNVEGKTQHIAGELRADSAVACGGQFALAMKRFGVEDTVGIGKGSHEGVNGNINTHIFFVGKANGGIIGTGLRLVGRQKDMVGTHIGNAGGNDGRQRLDRCPPKLCQLLRPQQGIFHALMDGHIRINGLQHDSVPFFARCCYCSE